jgi:hypothetical protein
MSRFERFIGIDWSGAKGASQPGIQVAELEINAPSPQLKYPPKSRYWSRSDVIEYIGQLGDRPTLVGIDFAFSVPWGKGSAVAPTVNDVRALWALVDQICEGEPHLFAGPIWTRTDSPFRPFIFHHQSGHRGQRYERRNLRKVEELEGNAISIYHMAGPQVGAGSFSGMRMLHQIANLFGEAIAIWPFDKVDCTKTTVVEIYPSFFYREAGVKRPSSKDLKEFNYAAIDGALRHYGATLAADGVYRSVDQADALVAAAALRRLADSLGFEVSAGGAFDLREGWIFGLSG